ncbi:hypothetical protein ACFCW2_09865 [Qipengyuania sp. DSG2-2]|uniref:hypothetical protein n=1 Tax=Qipengyuania sp. DGS2-2 TaxID=3349631 RepID=UPI0036D37FE0
MRTAFAMVSVLALAACGGDVTDSESVLGSPELAVVEDGSEADGTPDEATDEATDDSTDGAGDSGREDDIAQPVACQEGEETLFSCDDKGGKQIAVCGKDGNAQYRFGNEVAEITLDNGKFASVPYSGGGEAQIAFSNGDTRYIVFSRIVRTNFEPGEPNNPEITDGVMVVRGGETIGKRTCIAGSPSAVDVGAGENYGGVASELFYEG